MWSNLWAHDFFVPEQHLEMLIKLWYLLLNAEYLIYAFLIPLWLRQMQRAFLCWTYVLVTGRLFVVAIASWMSRCPIRCLSPISDFLYGILLADWWSFFSCDKLIFPWHCNQNSWKVCGAVACLWLLLYLTLTYISRSVRSFSYLSFVIILDGIKDDDS